jgi:glycosyltransferase involved in cell wall biosynthesis
MLTLGRSITVAAFTGGLRVPSARFRIRQFVPMLSRHGISVEEMPAAFGAFPPKNRAIRPLWALLTLLQRVPDVLRSHNYDVVLLQREMLATFSTLEQFTKAPRVLDVDDAIFLYKRGQVAKRLAKLSALIICGNEYLAAWFSRWNANVRILPTSIDTERYRPAVKGENNESVVIGWIGTSSNLGYLVGIEDALRNVLTARPQARLRIISDERPRFRSMPSNLVEYMPWDETTEIGDIQSMDIGIMPLEDTDWTRGKCSFKMLQFMACGVPVVVSPIGMNAQVLAKGLVGVGASSETDWTDALIELVDSRTDRVRLGATGRTVVERDFSLDAIAPRLAECLASCV